MSRLAKQKVHAALERAAHNILSAAGDDPIVSRKDIRHMLKELTGTERELTDILYRFIDHRDYKPGARITRTDIDDTLAYAKTTLVDAYDVNNNGLSEAEVVKMSLTARLAVRFARLQDQLAQEALSTEQLAEQLAALGEGLYFPAWANEADAYLSLFRQEADLQTLTQDTFSATLGLAPNDPAQAIELWHQGRAAYQWIFDAYENYGLVVEMEAFKTLHAFMAQHLTQLTHVVVGRDGLRPDSEYPVYLVGLTPQGDLLGFRTSTIWT